MKLKITTASYLYSVIWTTSPWNPEAEIRLLRVSTAIIHRQLYIPLHSDESILFLFTPALPAASRCQSHMTLGGAVPRLEQQAVILKKEVPVTGL